MGTTRLVRAERFGERVEISAQQQLVCVTDNGDLRPATVFGGRHSRSGLTYWPAWVESGAKTIPALSSITRGALDEKRSTIWPVPEWIECFSGGGGRMVRYYSATVPEIDRELAEWDRWRARLPKADVVEEDHTPDHPDDEFKEVLNPEMEQEPEAHSDAACIARAISFQDVSSGAPTSVGRRLTFHEVERYAEEIVVIDDQTGRGPILRASFRWGFCAEAEFPASGLGAVWIIAEPPPPAVREPNGDNEPLFVEEE